MNDTAHHTNNQGGSDFKALLDLATPELYDHNAFRLLEVHVEATERDLAKRKQVMEVASRNRLPVPVGPCRILPRTPLPDDHDIRECSHAIQDAERRLAQEFYWFWPLTVGQAGNDAGLRQLQQGDGDSAASTWRSRERSPEEGPAAKHNLAVLYHFAALEIEKEFLDGKAPPSVSDEANTAKDDQEIAKTADAERHWTEANKYWKMIAVEQSCWSRVVTRIRAMDDKSLTTGAARRMERCLPVALTLIQARLAIRAHQQRKDHHAQRYVTRIHFSGFAKEAVDEALRIAVGSTRSTIKSFCEAAKRDADTAPTTANAATERLLEQVARPLALLDLLLAESNPARIAEHDQVALAALSCQIIFGNKTDNWKDSLKLLDRLAPLAASTAAKERITENRKIVQSNYESSLCWYCDGSAGIDSCAVDVKMHGEVERIPVFNGTRTQWRSMTITVPRCQACRDEMSVTGVIQGFAIAIAPWLFNSQTKEKRRPSFVKRSKKDFPRIKKLLSEGWDFGEKPPGVQ